MRIRLSERCALCNDIWWCERTCANAPAHSDAHSAQPAHNVSSDAHKTANKTAHTAHTAHNEMDCAQLERTVRTELAAFLVVQEDVLARVEALEVRWANIIAPSSPRLVVAREALVAGEDKSEQRKLAQRERMRKKRAAAKASGDVLEVCAIGKE